jgi:hypothetical protein
MTDPHRIQGPSGSPEPTVPKKDRTVGPDDFKKYMVEEVKETDAEQRGRKRKRRDEGEEETEAEKKAVGAAPQAPTTAPIGTVEAGPAAATGGTAPTPPPSLEGAAPPTTATPAFKADEIEQFAWEDEAKRVASQPPPTSAAPQAAPPQAQPPPEEPEVEEAPPTPPQYEQYYSQGGYQQGGYQEGYQYQQGTSWEGLAQPSFQQQQGSSTQGTYGPEKTSDTGAVKGKAKQATPPTEEKSKAKKGPKKKPTETPKLLAKEGKAKKGAPGEFKALMEEPKAKATEEKKKAAPSEKKEPSVPTSGRMAAPLGEGVVPMTGAVLPEKPVILHPEEEAIGPVGALPSTKKEEAGKISKRPEEQKEEEEIEAGIPAGIAMAPGGAQAGQGDTGKEGKPKEGEELAAGAPLIAGPLPMEGAPLGVIAETGTPALTSVSPYAELHPEILSLFERMVGVLTVMKTAGITETTLILSEKAFAGTVLSGTSIKISEYRFAAGELNLEFSGSPQAIALLQQHLPSLATALSRAGLVVKRTDFIFSRKEAPGGRGGEGEKEHEQGSSR